MREWVYLFACCFARNHLTEMLIKMREMILLLDKIVTNLHLRLSPGGGLLEPLKLALHEMLLQCFLFQLFFCDTRHSIPLALVCLLQ